MKRIPEIRLKGFEGEWKPSTIGDISDSFSGGTPSARESAYYGGTIPFIRSGEISSDRTELFLTESGLQNSSAKIVNKGTLLYALYGATSGEVAISKIKGAINQAILAILPHKGYDTSFLNFWLRSNKENITSTLLQGGQGNLSGELVKRISIHFPPSNKEQQSIGSFFYSYDHLISEHQQRLENLRRVKKSMLQKMFPQQGQTVPEIRFKGFEGEWEKAKLSSISSRVTRKNANLETRMPVTISSQDGIVEQTTFFNNVVASSNLRNYYLIKRGEFAYNKSYSNGFPFGSVKRLDKYKKGALSTLYIVFSLSEKINSDYIVYFFETSLWYREVALRATEGARNHGLLNIGAEDFLDIEITLPKDNDEQRQIGAFFTSLDNLINQEVKYIDQLNRVKHTLLQKMFV